MSSSQLTETDPFLQIYEAQAIIIEKNEEIKEKDAEIKRLKQEIESLRMAISKGNHQELAQKVTTLEQNLAVSVAENLKLSNRLEILELVANKSRNQEELSQKIVKLEEEISAAKNNNCDLINRLTSLELHANQMAEQLNNLFLFKMEKESEIQNTSILILGGWLALNSIYLLDSKTQSWKKLSITLPMGWFGFGAVVLNEEIYIFGGYANWNPQQGCYKLKDDGSWIKLASLNQRRNDISNSSLVYKGDIWVIGGYSENSFLKSVEKYDISQNKWTNMPKLTIGRSNAAAAVFKDRIFATGGSNRGVLKSVEMFDPKLHKWILFCDLPIQVSDHTMLISNSTLSIFGGYSKSGRLNSVWEMDIEDPEKKWTEKKRFKQPRMYFGIGKLSNEIIVFGDCDNTGETSEIFDGDEWIDGPVLPQKLSRFAYTFIPQSLEKSFLEKFS